MIGTRHTSTSRPRTAVGKDWINFLGVVPMAAGAALLHRHLWAAGALTQLALGAAIAAYLWVATRRLTSLELLGLGLAVASVVSYFGLGSTLLLGRFAPAVFGLVALQIGYSLVRGEPWTMQFSKRTRPPEVWGDPRFVAGNREATGAWGACFLACCLLTLLAPDTRLATVGPIALVALTIKYTGEISARARRRAQQV